MSNEVCTRQSYKLILLLLSTVMLLLPITPAAAAGRRPSEREEPTLRREKPSDGGLIALTGSHELIAKAAETFPTLKHMRDYHDSAIFGEFSDRSLTKFVASQDVESLKIALFFVEKHPDKHRNILQEWIQAHKLPLHVLQSDEFEPLSYAPDKVLVLGARDDVLQAAQQIEGLAFQWEIGMASNGEQKPDCRRNESYVCAFPPRKRDQLVIMHFIIEVDHLRVADVTKRFNQLAKRHNLALQADASYLIEKAGNASFKMGPGRMGWAEDNCLVIYEPAPELSGNEGKGVHIGIFDHDYKAAASSGLQPPSGQALFDYEIEMPNLYGSSSILIQAHQYVPQTTNVTAQTTLVDDPQLVFNHGLGVIGSAARFAPKANYHLYGIMDGIYGDEAVLILALEDFINEMVSSNAQAVINLSLNRATNMNLNSLNSVEALLQTALMHNIVSVQSAGNYFYNGVASIPYGAYSYPSSITIAAVTGVGNDNIPGSGFKLSAYSNAGVVAFYGGGSIISSPIDHTDSVYRKYALGWNQDTETWEPMWMMGTSFAAPVAAAAISIYISTNSGSVHNLDWSGNTLPATHPNQGEGMFRWRDMVSWEPTQIMRSVGACSYNASIVD